MIYHLWKLNPMKFPAIWHALNHWLCVYGTSVPSLYSPLRKYDSHKAVSVDWKGFSTLTGGSHYYCRNIIEKSYSDSVLQRRGELEASQQDALLRQFNLAKEGSWSEERRQRRNLMQQGNAPVIVGLCVIILALILILAMVMRFAILWHDWCLTTPNCLRW